mgnify:CR=1 FL=1
MTEGIRKSENGEIGGKCVFLGTNEGAGCTRALRARGGADFARAGMRKGGRAYI